MIVLPGVFRSFAPYNSGRNCMGVRLNVLAQTFSTRTTTPLNSTVRVRFAPSPTGSLHIGGLRTALYNYLFARRSNGAFILRIEDTDTKRTLKGSASNLMRMLKWCGYVGGSYGPYRQSERLHLYQETADNLLKSGHAYRCFSKTTETHGPLPLAEENERLASGEPYTVRLVVPQSNSGFTTFIDQLRGEISVPNDTINAQILLKSDGWPTYHLASVVDDHKMKITHVIRGEEWLSSTPKHILLYRALQWPVPEFIHLPLLLNKDKSKISKRQKHAGVDWYQSQGYMPTALINFVALMGWSPSYNTEVCTMKTLQQTFDISKAQTSAAIVNTDKLDWLDKQHTLLAIQSSTTSSTKEIQMIEKNNAFNLACDVEYISSIIKLMNGRTATRQIFIDGALDKLNCNDELYETISNNYNNSWTSNSTNIMSNLYNNLYRIDSKDWTIENIQNTIKIEAKHNKLKIGQVMKPLRFAISGAVVGAPLANSISLLGRTTVLRRLQYAIDVC
eukprot:GSMAST32.ASY1.ANO1.1058.1 assembled CDS